MGKKQYLIIGNSAAGISAAKTIRRHDPAGAITIVSDEPGYGYSRVLLPLYIAGKLPPGQMTIAARELYSSLGVRLLRGESVCGIHPKDRRAVTENGLKLPYDFLLLAAGASPVRLNIPGIVLKGVHYLRKMSDARGIREELSCPDPVLVVGGGLVGVKTVEALLARKKKVVWVISSAGILSQALDREASEIFFRRFQQRGVDIRLRSDVAALEGRGRVEKARLSNGTVIPCGMAVIGKGVEPNTRFLNGTGVALGRGVVVDEQMATNLPGVFAAGDLCEPFDIVQGRNAGNGLWPWAVEGGRAAGSNMAGVPAGL
ncbi:MAG TPA: FAD-dependent oxidoreductase, partial [Thermodesulfobacteriota bacterium]|nr:FAD-dependent oxidoreductase [Thermodesulfobacteriota bacterium]